MRNVCTTKHGRLSLIPCGFENFWLFILTFPLYWLLPVLCPIRAGLSVNRLLYTQAQVSYIRLNAYGDTSLLSKTLRQRLKGHTLTSFRPDAQKPALNNITPGENVMRSSGDLGRFEERLFKDKNSKKKKDKNSKRTSHPGLKCSDLEESVDSSSILISISPLGGFRKLGKVYI